MTYAIIDIRENLAFEYHFESVENPKLVEITAPWFLEKLKFSTPNGLRATVSGLRPTESRWKKNNEKKKIALQMGQSSFYLDCLANWLQVTLSSRLQTYFHSQIILFQRE